jgi:non-heme chloroperoxidase
MSSLTTKEGVRIFDKDWGTGQPVVRGHGRPLSADAWDGQLFFLSQHGYRTIAPDRRAHGRSTQTFSQNDRNGYADDLAALIEILDLKDVVLWGAPPEVASANPEGLPMGVFDQIRAGVAGDRSQDN